MKKPRSGTGAESHKGQAYGTAIKLLELARLLVARRTGVSVKEMAEHLGCSFRVAQRYRVALEDLFGPQLVEMDNPESNKGEKLWRIEQTELLTRIGPTADELAALQGAVSRLKADGHDPQATLLDSLTLKIEAAQRQKDRVRVEPDLESLLEAEGLAQRPRPRQKIDVQIAETLREAIKASKRVILHYRARSTGRLTKPLVAPYGFLLGTRQYLVAYNLHPSIRSHMTYILANIERADIQEKTFERDVGFSLRAFAERSFGVWHDGTIHDVTLRFAPEVAADARSFLFHPTQSFEEESDGSVLLRFQASGQLEMCWHLFTWGKYVEIVEPDHLRTMMCDLLRESLSRLTNE